jgi:serine/threonine protein kinase
LEPGQVVSLMEEHLSAIAHAHSKEVIHRDVKPQNILLRSGTDGVLTDFGVAYAVESTGRTSTMTAGTSGYIAPEVTSGRFDNTIDIYSAGVVLYKMLGGEFPLDVNTLPPSTFPELVKIIERATAPRTKRYSRAGEMLDDIRKIGSKIIAPTIQSIARTGDERILFAVSDPTWKLLDEALKALKSTLRCNIADVVKKVHWYVPSVTVVDYLALAGSSTDPISILRACTALGTRTIIINCPSENEARPLLKAGAPDCLASLETPGAIDGLKTSIETLIMRVQLGGGAWWKRVLG